MTLAELYAKLETMENGADLVAATKAEVTRLNAEAKNQREAKEAAEAMVKKLTGERDELQGKLSAFEKSDGKDTTAYKTLAAEMSAMKKAFEAEKAARAEEQAKRTAAEINAQAVDALTKGNALDPKEFAKLIVPYIKTDDAGEHKFYSEDGAEMSIEEGAQAWLKTRPWAVRDTQKPGSGNSGGKPPAGGRGTEQITLRDAISSVLTTGE